MKQNEHQQLADVLPAFPLAFLMDLIINPIVVLLASQCLTHIRGHAVPAFHAVPL
jgi:hypothetical protein